MKRIEVSREIINLWEDAYFEVVEYYPEYYEVKYMGEVLFTTSNLIPVCYECAKTSLTHKFKITYETLISVIVNLDNVNTSNLVKEFWKKHVEFVLGYFNSILHDTNLSVTYDIDGFSIWEKYNDDVLYTGDADGCAKYIKLYKQRM